LSCLVVDEVTDTQCEYLLPDEVEQSRNSGAAFSFAPAATVLFTGMAVGVAALKVAKAPAAVGGMGGSTRPAAGRSRRGPV
jgi:hypothetical protein